MSSKSNPQKQQKSHYTNMASYYVQYICHYIDNLVSTNR